MESDHRAPPDGNAPSLDRSALLFHDAPVAVYLRNADGKLVDANKAMATLLGYDSPADFLAAMATVPEQFYLDQNVRQSVWDRLVQDGRVTGLQFQAFCRDGFVIWVEESASRIVPASGETIYVGYLHDITAEKSTRWALVEVEEKYRAIFENAVEGLFQLTPAGRFVTVNAALARMLAYPSTAALTALPDAAARLFVLSEDWRRFRAAFHTADVVQGFEAELHKADGARIFASVHARAVRDIQGAIVLFEGSMEDVTERRQSQEQLRHSLRRTRELFHQTVKSLATTVRFRDPYTAGHQDNVARLATAMARTMGLSEDTLAGIRVAGQLHDIGKINVPIRYLNKPGRLVGLEWEFMKQHAQIGYEILKDIDFPWPVAEIVWAHHERLDGSGYPRGLGGAAIGIEARILAVADVLDAMASNRPYRPALGVSAALAELARHRGTAFDPEAVDAAWIVIRDGVVRY